MEELFYWMKFKIGSIYYFRHLTKTYLIKITKIENDKLLYTYVTKHYDDKEYYVFLHSRAPLCKTIYNESFEVDLNIARELYA